jgi:hypothetical protein
MTPSEKHLSEARACRRLPPGWRQCVRVFYGLINLAMALTARRRPAGNGNVM